MKIKRAILCILLFTISLTIFLFSGQNGSKSVAISDKFTVKVIDKYERITDTKINASRKNEIVNSSRFKVRKTAHFAIYFVLGLVAYLLLSTYNLKYPLLWAICFSFLFACSDEVHQLFSHGRTARVFDVFIDTTGAMCGILFTKMVSKIFKKTRRSKVMKRRGFEKISFEQFKKDISEDENLYREYELPKRDSMRTACYDIYILEDFTINPNEIKKIPTGLKSYFEDDEVLMLIVRSSMGFKYNIRLCNQVGIIDADYYDNADNEGHMWLRIQNEGDKAVTFKKGDAIAQGLFLKYLTTDDDSTVGQDRRSDY